MRSAPEDDVSLHHLVERLGIVEQHLFDEFERRRFLEEDDDDWRLRGLYVTPDAVETLLRLPMDRPVPVSPQLAEHLEDLETRAAQLESAGHRVRLRELATYWGLDDLDVHLLLLVAAAAIDSRFELVFGYLNDDVAQRTPTVGLALQLAGLSTTSAASRARLSASGRLVRLGLVEVDEDATRLPLARTTATPPRVVAHLLGDDTPDELLRNVVVPLPRIANSTTELLVRAITDDQSLLYVHDEGAASGVSAAAGAAAELGREVLGVDLTMLPPAISGESAARAAVREAVLSRALLVIDLGEAPGGGHVPAIDVFARSGVTTVVCGRGHWNPTWSSSTPLVVRAEPPTTAEVTAMWTNVLGDDVAARPDVLRTLTPLRLSPQQAVRAVRAAADHASMHDRPLSMADVLTGVRGQSASGLQKLTRRVEADADWNDLVVPGTVRRELEHLAVRWRSRDRVLGDWSMSSGPGRGRGVSALFAGPSGTGKTLAAEVIAGELGLDLYIVDLSTVVDKYIGETSKNIDRIFEEADRVNGVLLFDEADALFGKRSAVSDAKDRNANLEVAHLLQRMESFDGVAILTTNLASNLDDAFLRRLDAIVDFPRPDASIRQRLWDTLLGTQVPLASDVDTAQLAERLRLSGGEIRNVVLTASFWAADRGTPVSMEDLLLAAVREYRKIQKPLTASDLGPWAGLLD